MSVTTVGGILTTIPWKDIVKYGPTLLEAARELFKRSKEQSAKETLEERVERLEGNEKVQAQLIEQLVERQELLLSAIQVINSRLKLLFICALVTVVGLATCILVLLFK